jgi:RHS repeat-associated protein
MSTVDPLGNATNFTYTPTTIESAMVFNGNASTVDILTTLDALGRKKLVQTRRAPGLNSFDTIQYTYDSNGRPATASMPCIAAAGTGCSGPVTTTTYDAMNRTLQVTDGGGGYTSSSYTKNDILVTIGPAPLGENTKQRQLEHDGLGRLTSVCEITSGVSSGTCGQVTSKTGYWTKYTYNSLGELLTVAQNAQGTPQTRTYAYDAVGRMISETNPETGTTQYFYDTAPTTPGVACTGTYNGDLVKRYDANGNTSCYTYDGLHRILSTSYSGPNPTSNRYFIYDTATVSGQVMANARGKVAEAYTATCPTCSKVTDEGFSYSARGELAAFYETTPHSSGYYSVPMTYWENGLLKTFGPFLTEFKVGYNPDGEGRAGGFYDYNFSTYRASNITYNAASQPTQLMTACVPTCHPITYAYDQNTPRMTQYSVGLNTGTISGTLTWNPNGSLKTLVVADPLNTADAQTCNYVGDDLGRVASVNCGSTWAQTFNYDPFGNITKSGSISWMPGYNTSTNRYTLSGTSYDANGNLLTDGFLTQTWDAEGKALSAAAAGNQTRSFVNDAFGHMVEMSVNGTAYSYVRIGNFNLSATGQTAYYSEYGLPGGSMLSLNAGATGYQLADWLGTVRVFYSLSGDFSQSGAHAPFGESYALNGGYQKAFTGQDHDANMDIYYFPERLYSANQGRWRSPDPAGLQAVYLGDPKTWNRYAYVLNSPLNTIDPNGLWCVWEDGTHDDNPGMGGYAQSACTDAGGHWDPFDTFTGIFADENGVLTQINTIYGSFGGMDMTLEGFDQTLQNYSVLGVSAADLARPPDLLDTVGLLHFGFVGNEEPVSWRRVFHKLSAGDIYSCIFSPDASIDIANLSKRMANVGVAPSAPTDNNGGAAPSGLSAFGAQRQNMLYLNNSNNRSGFGPSVNPSGSITSSAAAAGLDHANSFFECAKAKAD